MYKSFGETVPYSGRKESKVSRPPITLKLTLKKKKYRRGEPIPYSVLLENETKVGQYFFIGADLGEGSTIMPNHQIMLSIKNAKGKEVQRGLASASPAIRVENVQEKLNRYYILLRPNYQYGINGSLDVPLPVGKYIVSATYDEFEAQKWSLEPLNSSVNVWTTSLHSNKIRIIIK